MPSTQRLCALGFRRALRLWVAFLPLILLRGFSERPGRVWSPKEWEPESSRNPRFCQVRDAAEQARAFGAFPSSQILSLCRGGSSATTASTL